MIQMVKRPVACELLAQLRSYNSAAAPRVANPAARTLHLVSNSTRNPGNQKTLDGLSDHLQPNARLSPLTRRWSLYLSFRFDVCCKATVSIGTAKMYQPSLRDHTQAIRLDNAPRFSKTAAITLLLAFSSQALARPSETSTRHHDIQQQDSAIRGYWDMCCRLSSKSNDDNDQSVPPELRSEDSIHKMFTSQLPSSWWPSSILSGLMNLITPALLFTAEACCTRPVYEVPDSQSSNCETTNSWPGFAGVKNVFSFGDSYTTTNFDVRGQQPTPDNPLGNPAYPGATSAWPAPNWIDFLTVEYNKSSFLTYNIAVGGATVNQNLVVPLHPLMLSLTQQIYELFVPIYHPKTGTGKLSRPWHGDDTLVAIWIGINDVNGSFGKGPSVTGPLNMQIMAAYRDLLQFLYVEMGFRNFVLLNVPPIDRSPQGTMPGEEMQQLMEADVADFNGLIWKMARGFRKDVATKGNVWVYDTNKDFGKAMDNPKSFPQTSMLKNLTDSCDAYGPA